MCLCLHIYLADYTHGKSYKSRANWPNGNKFVFGRLFCMQKAGDLLHPQDHHETQAMA